MDPITVAESVVALYHDSLCLQRIIRESWNRAVWYEEQASLELTRAIEKTAPSSEERRQAIGEYTRLGSVARTWVRVLRAPPQLPSDR